MNSICRFWELGPLGDSYRNSGFAISCPWLPGRKVKNVGTPSQSSRIKGPLCPLTAPGSGGRTSGRGQTPFLLLLGAGPFMPQTSSLRGNHACFSLSQFPSHNMGCGDPPPPEVQQGRRSSQGETCQRLRVFHGCHSPVLCTLASVYTMGCSLWSTENTF